MIKGILFDKDGTLLDFNQTWLEPYLKVARYLEQQLGKPGLGDLLMRNGGFIPETTSWVSDSLLASGSNLQILEFWSQQIGQPIQGDHLQYFNLTFAHASNNYVPALDDLHGFLKGLQGRKIKLGLATMDDESNALGMLEKLGLTHFFDFVCGANSGYGIKPEPGMVHAFCDACNISPGQVIMVGDSPKDLNMGRNARVAYSIGVLTGAHDREGLEQYSDYVFENISGLENLLQPVD
jgi:phosphoglycolate phosphatase